MIEKNGKHRFQLAINDIIPPLTVRMYEYKNGFKDNSRALVNVFIVCDINVPLVLSQSIREDHG